MKFIVYYSYIGRYDFDTMSQKIKRSQVYMYLTAAPLRNFAQFVLASSAFRLGLNVLKPKSRVFEIYNKTSYRSVIRGD